MCLESLKSRNDLNLNEINQLLDLEKNIDVFKKLQYFKFKEMGFSKIESCKLAGLKESSRYYLEKLWYIGGYNSLVPHYGGGRSSKLTDEQLNDLKNKLNQKDSWLVKDVQKLIKDEYNVEYGYNGVRTILIKFNIEIDNYFENNRLKKKNPADISDDDQREIKIIIEKMDNEKSVFVYRKLNYLLFRHLGFSNAESSKFLNITPVTGNTWFKTWQNDGYEGLKRKPGQGRKSKS